eukprot:gene25818-11493_t
MSLGNCSYLDTCRNMRQCKYIHYELDHGADAAEETAALVVKKPMGVPNFDMAVCGKFGVVMADPPWEIHQDLPYGTMADDEMRNMNIGCLQDEGFIFLWVTGRCPYK